MREIRFRAWDKLKNCMVLDVPTSNGRGMSWRKAPNSSVTCCIEMEGKTVHCYSDWDFIKEDISLELMQFTGLKDIHGKDIYEGDIIKSTSFGLVYSVDWEPSAATFLFQLLGAPIMDYEGMDAFGDEIEIIGNIHENPELMGDNQ